MALAARPVITPPTRGANRRASGRPACINCWSRIGFRRSEAAASRDRKGAAFAGRSLADVLSEFGGLTYEAYRDHDRTNLQVPADEAARRFQDYGIASIALLSAAVAAAALAAYLPWHSSRHGDR